MKKIKKILSLFLVAMFAVVMLATTEKTSAATSVSVTDSVALTFDAFGLDPKSDEIPLTSSHVLSNGLSFVWSDCFGRTNGGFRRIQVKYGSFYSDKAVEQNITAIAIRTSTIETAYQVYSGSSANPTTAENQLVDCYHAGTYFVYFTSGSDNHYFAVKGFIFFADLVVITGDTSYTINTFESLETQSSLALNYTDNGDSTYTVDSLKLRYGTNNQITKAFYDRLVETGTTLKFGVRLAVAGGTTVDYDMTKVVFVDKNGDEVKDPSDAVYVNFSVVVPVTDPENYSKVVTGKVYVSIDGTKYFMGLKAYSVDTLCAYYVNNELYPTEEVKTVLNYISTKL